MIATTSSGRRFAALARYLLHGRSGLDPERVAWTAGRNLGLDDPELAAVLMQATADENLRVDVPVYHLTINFDPRDPVTPAEMQAVADRVLRDLGLAEHQALLVAHQDRAHAHVHIMVNRVHPETGVAWERWQDRPRIERTLRELERELGLREVAGRLYQLEGQEPPERALLTNGERRQALRTGEPALPDRIREHLHELRAARSWAELQKTLAVHGLHLERKGQGLVITDGKHQVKASRVARDLSLRQLEKRFGKPFPGREEELARHEQSRDVAQLQSAIEEIERVTGLEKSCTSADQELQLARRRLDRIDSEIRTVHRAEERFMRALGPVYADPVLARARIETAAAQLGRKEIGAILEAEPERFGALRTVPKPRAFGLLIAQDDSQARHAARRAAFDWRELLESEGRLATLATERVPNEPKERTVPWGERAREHLNGLVQEMQARLAALKEELQELPSRALLERSINRVIGRLEPRELKQLRLVLTRPQRALVFKARQVIRDIALGREEDDEDD